MNPTAEKPTNVRYGVLGFACVLSMITYIDRVCFGTIAIFVRGEFGLTPSDMGWIFGAFTFAYAVFEVPTGWLGDVYGPRKTLIRIVLWWSVFTALTGSIYPSLGVGFAFAAMFAVRFLFGIGEAGAYPNIARAFHNWFPYQERGFAKGTVWMAGRFAGGVTPFLVLALLYESPTQPTANEQALLAARIIADAANPVAGSMLTVATELRPIAPTTHWRHVFWIFGVLGIVWCLAFWYWFRDRPEEHPGTNKAEVDLIHAGDPEHAKDPNAHATRIQVPWMKLFTSPNLWLICGMYFCASYGWYFNITYLPEFLRTQFKMDPGDKWSPAWWQYSLMAGMPLLVGSVACIVGGFMTDSFIKKTGNRKWGRRLFGVVGHGLCATFYFLGMLFMKGESPWPFMLCIAFATFWNDITMGAAWASCIDIGRRYSGIVAGCMNTIGNLGGFTANILTAQVINMFTSGLNKNENPTAFNAAQDSAWVMNFLIFSGVYVVAVFLWLGFDATKPIDDSDTKIES